MRKAFLAGAIAAGFMLSSAQVLPAADIEVLCVPPLRTALEELGPQFERLSGHKLTVKIDISANFRRQIDGGAPFDLAILASSLTKELIAEGKVVKDSSTDIARAALAVAIRKGASKPEISTTEGFKKMLLEAKAVSYSPQGTSGIHIAATLDRLGIAADVRPKLKAGPTGRIARPVAEGNADIALVYLPGVLLEPGVELAGLFPAELQNYDLYTAGINAAASQPDAARALMTFLVSPTAAAVIKAKGLESIGR